MEAVDKVVAVDQRIERLVLGERHLHGNRIRVERGDDPLERGPRIGEGLRADLALGAGGEHPIQSGLEAGRNRSDEVLLHRVHPTQDHRSDLLGMVAHDRLSEAGAIGVAVQVVLLDPQRPRETDDVVGVGGTVVLTQVDLVVTAHPPSAAGDQFVVVGGDVAVETTAGEEVVVEDVGLVADGKGG